jgi:thiol-disulfide isomerase/thioredoxin
MPRKLIVAVAALAIAAGAVLAVHTREARAPDVRFITLSGANPTTAELRGKVLLVNFWATSCVSCVEEMPKLAAAWRQ